MLGLRDQVPKPVSVTVVDDGSRDGTAKVAEALGCRVIRFPPHSENYAGRPELAYRWNLGFMDAKQANPDYLLMLGADHRLEPGYVKSVISHMDADTALSTGAYSNEATGTANPGGSGRVIRVSWFSRYGCLFPVEYGWESWMIYRAQADGYKATVDAKTPTRLSRPISRNPRKMLYWGRGSWCLGGTFPYIIHRCYYVSKIAGVKAALYMLFGYLIHPGSRKLDVADYVSRRHRRLRLEKIRKMVKLK